MPRANGTSPRHVPVISSAISSGVSLHSEDPVSAALVKRFAAGDVCDSGGADCMMQTGQSRTRHLNKNLVV
ncbi:hypothetical protein PC116_g9047 [Phytophthora cactorum]|nr:hypothetical protein PC116_g9047 [Phytophthora cactorum]